MINGVVKKHISTLEMDTFKVMLLLSYLAHDFKCPFLDIEITMSELSPKSVCNF